jgi:hypothetical protein
MKQKSKSKSHLSSLHVKRNQREGTSYLLLTVIMLQTLSNIYSLQQLSRLDYAEAVYISLQAQASRLSIAVLPTSSLTRANVFAFTHSDSAHPACMRSNVTPHTPIKNPTLHTSCLSAIQTTRFIQVFVVFVVLQYDTHNCSIIKLETRPKKNWSQEGNEDVAVGLTLNRAVLCTSYSSSTNK